ARAFARITARNNAGRTLRAHLRALVIYGSGSLIAGAPDGDLLESSTHNRRIARSAAWAVACVVRAHHGEFARRSPGIDEAGSPAWQSGGGQYFCQSPAVWPQRRL